MKTTLVAAVFAASAAVTTVPMSASAMTWSEFFSSVRTFSVAPWEPVQEQEPAPPQNTQNPANQNTVPRRVPVPPLTPSTPSSRFEDLVFTQVLLSAKAAMGADVFDATGAYEAAKALYDQDPEAFVRAFDMTTDGVNPLFIQMPNPNPGWGRLPEPGRFSMWDPSTGQQFNFVWDAQQADRNGITFRTNERFRTARADIDAENRLRQQAAQSARQAELDAITNPPAFESLAIVAALNKVKNETGAEAFEAPNALDWARAMYDRDPAAFVEAFEVDAADIQSIRYRPGGTDLFGNKTAGKILIDGFKTNPDGSKTPKRFGWDIAGTSPGGPRVNGPIIQNNLALGRAQQNIAAITESGGTRPSRGSGGGGQSGTTQTAALSQENQQRGGDNADRGGPAAVAQADAVASGGTSAPTSGGGGGDEGAGGGDEGGDEGGGAGGGDDEEEGGGGEEEEEEEETG